MRVLVFGGSGLIGAAIVRALLREGYSVAAIARRISSATLRIPDAEWIAADLAALKTPESWAPRLKSVDAVINAAGALQDGVADDLAAVHYDAIRAAIAAAQKAGLRKWVQISAPGASAQATTRFLRTKAAGDAVLRASSLDWIILKPALVIGREAWGGTALLRMLAAFPFAMPIVHAEAPLQTVALDDAANAVARAIRGEMPSRADYDLSEAGGRTLRETIMAMRAWMGLKPAPAIGLPSIAARPIALCADAAGFLGWRSPLRSTTLAVMSEGVVCDPEPWRRATGASLKSLAETLASMPATAQDRVFARAELALPVMLIPLALFWIASGVIGLVDLERASAHLDAVAAGGAAAALVAGGSLLDIAIGCAMLMRRTARTAAFASIFVAAAYLLAGTLIAPALWSDPLGVYVKVIPAMALGAGVALLIKER